MSKKFEKIYHQKGDKRKALGIHCNPGKDVYYVGEFDPNSNFEGRGYLRKGQKNMLCEFQKNKKSGIGRVIDGKHKIFTGGFLKNIKEGVGLSFDFSEKVMKKGIYLNGKFENFGVITLAGMGTNIQNDKIDKLFQIIGDQRNSLCADIKNKRIENFGVWTDKNIKYQYRGNFKKGQMDGYGEELTNEKGITSIYEGEFIRGFRTGVGSYVEFDQNKSSQNNKRKYILSNWKKGKKEGFGIQHYNNGNVYQGYFQNNLIHGIGILIFIPKNHIQTPEDQKGKKSKLKMEDYFETMSSSENALPYTYIGNFENTEKQGFGKLEVKGKFHYAGFWKKNMRNGVGYQVNLQNGNKGGESSYLGYWKNDKIEGIGIKTTVNYIYRGNWKNGKPHGYGLMEYKRSGEKVYGKWNQGELVTQVEMKNSAEISRNRSPTK